MLLHLPNVRENCCYSVIQDKLNPASRTVIQFGFVLKNLILIISEDDVGQLLTIYQHLCIGRGL